jgi:uncharacterized membrane protein
MSQETGNHHEELLRISKENNELAKQNQELIKQNQELLRKMYRNEMIGLSLRVVWYAVLIGLPVAAYFYLLEPYFQAFGANYETFRQGMGEIPGLKGLDALLP